VLDVSRTPIPITYGEAGSVATADIRVRHDPETVRYVTGAVVATDSGRTAI
jgi:hypothetical protein